MAARGDQLQRLFRPDDPGQPLGSAAARQYADGDFGQADLGAFRGDPVLAGQGGFQPAAQREPVDCGDDGLRAVIDDRAIGQPGLGLRLSQMLDIRAGDEGASGAGEDHGLHVGVGIAFVDAFDDAFRHPGAQRVDRRIVDRNDSDRSLF
jgi:hypothetical protein